MASLQDIAVSVVDSLFAALPQPKPEKAALEACRVISHRGEHDNKSVKENTMAAFAQATDSGVWGIECDIRFTADHVPVICHDPSTARVFGIDHRVDELTFDQLRRALPDVPSLEEVIATYGKRNHLMLEIKSEPWPESTLRRNRLRDLLAPLTPCDDYHLLSLEPAMFSRVDFAPNESFLPVAELNVKTMSELSLARGYAGIGGHFFLLNNTLRDRHAAKGQQLGTGFPHSRNALFRELNRGIEWIFTNNAVEIQAIRDEALRAYS